MKNSPTGRRKYGSQLYWMVTFFFLAAMAVLIESETGIVHLRNSFLTRPEAEHSPKEPNKTMLTPAVVNKAAQRRQQQAASALQRMKERGAMYTAFSTPDSVLKHGFPRRWDSCTLERIFQQKETGTELEIVVVGASASSLGNWSRLLQQQLDVESEIDEQKNNGNSTEGVNFQMNFKIHNRAQGSTGSVDNALILDENVSPDTTDVIVWEFYINGTFVE